MTNIKNYMCDKYFGTRVLSDRQTEEGPYFTNALDKLGKQIEIEWILRFGCRIITYTRHRDAVKTLIG